MTKHVCIVCAGGEGSSGHTQEERQSSGQGDATPPGGVGRGFRKGHIKLKKIKKKILLKKFNKKKKGL